MTGPRKAVLFYDGECRFCRSAVAVGRRLLPAARFEWRTLQAGKAGGELPLAEVDLRREMLLRTPDGKLHGGADAFVRLGADVWWLRPLAWMGASRGGRRFLHRGYRWIADHRGCLDHRCERPRSIGSGTGIFFAACFAGVAAASFQAPRWVTMWLIALGIFALAKWLTLRLGVRPGDSTGRKLAYLFLWVGMDARAFLHGPPPSAPTRIAWLAAVGRTLLGTGLVWILARRFEADILRAWTGLIGLILVLHFGLFHLLALAWRRSGVEARPIMDRPLHSRSLAEFWGSRWNRGFNDLVTRLLFRPVARRAGGTWGLLAVFAVSGLIHELVISVPAGAGYGLPTVYFLLQGAGILLERSRFGTGVEGRTFTLVVTAGPLFWLFHPPFLREIALPMFRALHAL